MKWNIYNSENGHYVKTIISDIQPDNSTNIEINVPIEFAKFDGTEWIDGRTPEEIKKQRLYEINQMQFEELSKTDWAYTRKQELEIEVPIEIVKERMEIRDKYKKLKNE